MVGQNVSLLQLMEDRYLTGDGQCIIDDAADLSRNTIGQLQNIPKSSFRGLRRRAVSVRITYRGEQDSPVICSNGPQHDHADITSHADHHHHDDGKANADGDNRWVFGL